MLSHLLPRLIVSSQLPLSRFRVSIIFERLGKARNESDRDPSVILSEEKRVEKSLDGRNLLQRLKIEFATNDRWALLVSTTYRQIRWRRRKSVETKIGAPFLYSRFTRPSSLHVLTTVIRCDHATASIKSVAISAWNAPSKEGDCGGF